VVTPDALAFLRATHSAVQAEAEAARGGGAGVWSVDCHPHYNGARIYDDQGEPVVFDEGSSPTPEQATHMALHDPAAVLRRIAAERKVLDGYELTVQLRDEAAQRIRAAGDAPTAADLDTWDRAQREAAILEEPVACIAEGWGWTEEET
jgi:hypothetical protein